MPGNNHHALSGWNSDEIKLKHRNAFKFSGLAFTVFTALQLSLGLNNIFSKEPLCANVHQSNFLQHANWITTVCYFTKATLILLTCSTSQRVLAGSSLDISGASCSCFTIILMSGISSLLTAITNWGGTCEDAFGVKTPGTLMGEWTACVPLILYYVLSMETKEGLSGTDFKILGSITLAMVCFDLLQVVDSYGISVFIFLCSHVFFLVAFVLMLASSRGWITSKNSTQIPSNNHKNNVKAHMNDGDNNSSKLAKELRLFTRRRLEFTLCLTFPLFICVYYLGLSKLLYEDVIAVMFIIANVITKVVFVSVAMDSYTVTVYQGFLEQIYANAARQAYLRFVMHEVRVPLSSIAMGIDALHMIDEEKSDHRTATTRSQSRMFLVRQADKESHEILSMMRDATAFMGNTLNSVLNIQKIEEGKLELTMSPFILKDLIHRVHQILKGNLHKKKINLTINVDDRIPGKLIGDAFQIEHVLANFLSNAIKFSSEGALIEIIISLCDKANHTDSARTASIGSNLFRASSFSFRRAQHSTKITQDSVWVRFAVRDHGIGISPENVANLFRPFMQVRPGELQGGGGSGVGLSICKQIVELHNGSVGCDSMEGEGSTFFFRLPLLVAETVEAPSMFPIREKPEFDVSASPRSDPRRISSIYLAGDQSRPPPGMLDLERSPSLILSRHRHSVDISMKNVLVVDDAATNRKLLLKLLSRRPVVCSEAADGAMAVEMVTEDVDRYQIIFMDNLMPNMNGLEAAKLIRGLGYRGIIIGLTGNALQDDVDRFIGAGADSVYAKPINLETLNTAFQFVDNHQKFAIRSQEAMEI